MYAAVTRAIAATQQMVSFCDAIKFNIKPRQDPVPTVFAKNSWMGWLAIKKNRAACVQGPGSFLFCRQFQCLPQPVHT
jgi:hypothetical protein